MAHVSLHQVLTVTQPDAYEQPESKILPTCDSQPFLGPLCSSLASFLPQCPTVFSNNFQSSSSLQVLQPFLSRSLSAPFLQVSDSTDFQLPHSPAQPKEGHSSGVEHLCWMLKAYFNPRHLLKPWRSSVTWCRQQWTRGNRGLTWLWSYVPTNQESLGCVSISPSLAGSWDEFLVQNFLSKTAMLLESLNVLWIASCEFLTLLCRVAFKTKSNCFTTLNFTAKIPTQSGLSPAPLQWVFPTVWG